MKISLILFFCLLSTSIKAQEHQHGLVNEIAPGKLQVWNDSKSKWSTLDAFWVDFAKSNEAKFWGITDTYPIYEDVNEFDTVLIQLKEGACLMQFFHARWRRANDVQRWDDAFNGFSGCPFVFD